MARVLRKNAVLMKARGIGYSEINASILANAYNCRHDSINILAASFEKYLTKTLDKVWAALNWLNDKTDGGFFKLRQVADTATLKRASHYKIENGQKIEEGWMSQVQGILADTPNKIRGDRADLLVYEELGSWPNSKKAFIQGDALVGIQGNRFGLKLGGGTGGDTGAALAGLRDMYRNPDVYDILEYKHNYTASGETTYSSYFIPATTLVDREDCTDSRGWTDPKKGKAYYDGERAKKAKDPEALLTYSAEYCYNAEEAFSLEGNNNFDKVILAEQLTAIRVTKTAPPVEKGTLSYTYSSPNHTFQNVSGYKWIESPSGKVQILEHPIWTDLYKSQQEMIRQSYQEKGMRYEPPVYDNVMNNLYVAGIDSIDIGAEDTSENTDNPSMFCIVIMKRQFGMQDPVIVAYYKDRPQHIRDAYKMAMCMVTYYQAIVNIEATRMNLYAWAREQGYYRYFMMRPRATYPDPNKIGKRTPGTPATPTII